MATVPSTGLVGVVAAVKVATGTWVVTTGVRSWRSSRGRTGSMARRRRVRRAGPRACGRLGWDIPLSPPWAGLVHPGSRPVPRHVFGIGPAGDLDPVEAHAHRNSRRERQARTSRLWESGSDESG